MSSMNGDKSRFHRERRQKIARRKRTRKLREHAGAPPKPLIGEQAETPKQVTA